MLRLLSPLSRLIRLSLALTIAAAGWTALPGQASAQANRPSAERPAQRIAAVVNSDVISVRDLESRMAIVMATGQLPNTPEVTQRLAPQILRALIDEKLKLQEAKRNGIKASPQEIEEGVRRLEQQNGLPPGGLRTSLLSAGLNWDAMLSQVEAEMAWISFVRRNLVARVNVSDEELAVYEAALQRNLGKPEYLLAEIFLAVDSASQEAEVLALGDRLIEQMRRGANFAALARQFSRSSSAQRGGDMGWIGPGDIDEEVMNVLATMQPGNVSKPIRTFGGYEIVLLRAKRTAGSAGQGTPLARVVLQTKGGNALPSDRLASVREQLGAIRGCDAFNQLASQLGSPSAPVSMINPAALPPPIQNAMRGLEVGAVSRKIAFDDAEVYVMTCDPPKEGLPPREELHERLAQRKLEGLSQRKMRDLRQQAVIDIRL